MVIDITRIIQYIQRFGSTSDDTANLEHNIKIAGDKIPRFSFFKDDELSEEFAFAGLIWDLYDISKDRYKDTKHKDDISLSIQSL